MAAGGRPEAEEVIQEAFVRLIKAWPVVSKYQDPEAWVRGVSFRLLSNRLRKGRNGLRVAVRLAVLAGEVGVVATQDADQDRVLPPAAFSISFQYPREDSVRKIVSMRYDGPLAPLNGPVTARYQGETACLRAEATSGRLVWADPLRGACQDRDASVLDQVLDVAPEQDRFPSQPIERTAEADGYLVSRTTPPTKADDDAHARCQFLSGAYDGGRATQPHYDVVLFCGIEADRPALEKCLTALTGVRVRETLTGRSLTPERAASARTGSVVSAQRNMRRAQWCRWGEARY